MERAQLIASDTFTGPKALVRSVAARPPLDFELAWETLGKLGRMLTDDSDETLRRALDMLATLLCADRALLLSGRHGEHVRCSTSADDADEPCPAVVDEALATGRTTQQDEPQMSAIAAALTGVPGVLYAELRYRPIQSHRDLLSCAATLFGAALRAPRIRAVSAPPPESPENDDLDLDEILDSAGLRGLRADVEACLRLESPILITGESGTGKTLLATAIARASGRAPVVRTMLGASDDLNTIASELFGHERGAFSGAVGRRSGLVELADSGVLILDEVLNLPLRAQQILLDLTQFGTYRPLGWQAPEPKRAHVRIIAATNGDLERAVAEGTFRRDLYYRLTGTVIRVPPLRERRADIPALAITCLRRLDASRRWTLSPDARRLLRSPELSWPGNIRELESALARATARALGEDRRATQLRPEHLDPAYGGVPLHRPAGPDAGASSESLAEAWRRITGERAALERAERELLERAVRESHGVLAHAARALQIPRTTLISRLSRAGIEPRALS
jgi:DNA-binding NtrC family response regulator